MLFSLYDMIQQDNYSNANLLGEINLDKLTFKMGLGTNMIFNSWQDIKDEEIEGHYLHILNVNDSDLKDAADDLALVVLKHYIDPVSLAHTLNLLGKSAAAEKLRIKLPQTKTLRSGDLGEILATEYINSHTTFEVPIYKLQWHDHREMAMRGDDVIGLQLTPKKKLRFIKTEAKSRIALEKNVVKKARLALDADFSRPAPHALAFVAERLRESGQEYLADKIELVQLKQGISLKQVEHLLFTFSGNNPKNIQRSSLRKYKGRVKQHAVGLFVKSHKEFVHNVFEAAKGL